MSASCLQGKGALFSQHSCCLAQRRVWLGFLVFLLTFMAASSSWKDMTWPFDSPFGPQLSVAHRRAWLSLLVLLLAHDCLVVESFGGILQILSIPYPFVFGLIHRSPVGSFWSRMTIITVGSWQRFSGWRTFSIQSGNFPSNWNTYAWETTWLCWEHSLTTGFYLSYTTVTFNTEKAALKHLEMRAGGYMFTVPRSQWESSEVWFSIPQGPFQCWGLTAYYTP